MWRVEEAGRVEWRIAFENFKTASTVQKISFLIAVKTLLLRSHWPKAKEQMELSFT